MTRKNLEEKIIAICENISAVETTLDTSFGVVCWDTFDFIDIIMECEKVLDTVISDNGKDESSFDSVKDFIDWVQQFVNID